MKMKTLLAAAVFFAFSAAAFAQATYTVGSTPVTQVVKSGQTEKTGDISFTHVTGSGVSVAGTITITYGVPITIPFGNITVTGTNTDPGGYGVGAAPAVNADSSNSSAGVLVINVPAGKTQGSIRVSGVRVAVAGTTLTNLNAGISSFGNLITAGQTNVEVIKSIAAGITSVTVDPSSGIIINSVSGVASGSPSTIRVTEGFLNAFGVTASGEPGVSDPTQTGSTMVKITLSSPPPAGVTLTFHNKASTKVSPSGAASVTDAFQIADCVTGATSGSDATFTSASTALAVCYGVVKSTNTQVLERLEIPVTFGTSGTATLPIPSTTVNVTATLAPIGPAFGTNNAVLTGPIPRYAEEQVGPATLASVVGANTTLLIPFATTVTAAGYDTGIAVSNSTKDPGKSAMGVSSAIGQSGTVTFYFYPQAPATTGFSYTTKAGSPGAGLDASGNLPSGSTYSVLLSQLLAAAGQPKDFTGYIFVISNFTNAHCLYVATNFAGFAQGAMALVITGNRDGATESLNN